MNHPNLLPEMLLRAEIQQRREEGCDVSELSQQVEDSIRCGRLGADSVRYWSQLEKLHPSQEEPSVLVNFRNGRASSQRYYPLVFNESELYDRVYGGWLGRCAGCTLGKPVEGWLHEKIVGYLRIANAYPLNNYFPILTPFPSGLELHANHLFTAQGKVKRMARDDDLDYTVLALRILEEYGVDFSTNEVALAWLKWLPYYQIFNAEAVAYHNLICGYEPPDTARYHNPYREWIGAQIRADFWGYVNPGNPERAAAMAYRDATLSHTSNGIYGAMWAAAAIATAYVSNDPRLIIQAGLTSIPEQSRLAEAVRYTMQLTNEYPTWEDAWEKVNARYGNLNWVHVINNTCSIILALLYGQGDMEKSICLAVMGGWDTDCTGATTGSILGVMLGAKALPEKWISPLQDRLESYIPGDSDVRISQLAERTYVQILRILYIEKLQQ